jgi:hypothetical protein
MEFLTHASHKGLNSGQDHAVSLRIKDEVRRWRQELPRNLFLLMPRPSGKKLRAQKFAMRQMIPIPAN